MKKQIVMFFAAVMAVISAQAATWTDPDTGYTWTYTVSGDTAQIYKGNNAAAISPSPTGELTIPSQLNGKTVTNIGNYAFVGCSGLTGVTIPDGVTSIGQYAFQNCTGLTGTLTIPGSVTSIGNYAFNGCSNLTGLVLSSGVTSIGQYAFQNCTGLTGTLTIPGSVTSIGSYAFDGCSGLTGVTMTDSVNTMGDYAFRNCSGLANVTTVGPANDRAFSGCASIASVTIVGGAVGASAFSGKTGLTVLTINDGVTSIGNNAFQNCTGLAGTLTIPESVTNIGNYAFDGCSGLTGLVLSSGVTSIGQYAFKNCTGLIGTLTIPVSVTSIGQYAFQNCSGITGVEASGGNLSNSIFNGCVSLETVKVNGPVNNSMFNGCDALKSVEVLGGVIANEAFKWRTDLTSVKIAEGVTSIGDYAFDSCRNLKMITIPNSVTNIGKAAFRNCVGMTGQFVIPDSVKTMNGGYGNDNWLDEAGNKVSGWHPQGAFSGCIGFTSLIITDGVDRIGEYAFYGCSSLTGPLAIPESVTSIGDYAFSSCNSLTGPLTIPGSVMNIGNYAFDGCNGFTGTLTIQEGVVNIGTNAFGACTGFTAVSLPTTIERVCRAFNGAIGINSVVIAEGATIVGGFSGCTGLVEVDIPNSVTNIDAYAFAICTELVNLNMPTNIKVIGEYAFQRCYKLQKLEWLPGVTVGAYAFTQCGSWKGVFNVPDGVTEIAEGVFCSCSGLQQINLPDTITTIGKSAFAGCNSITEMVLPEGLSTISETLFSCCTQLRKVVIPSSVKIIEGDAFYTCYALSELNLPNGLTRIGISAFANSGIKSLTIPETVVSFHSYAFSGFQGQITFLRDLPVGYEQWSWWGSSLPISFPRSSGERGFVTWPVTQFMGYSQTNTPTVTIISSKIRENDPEVMDVVFKVNSTKSTVKVRALAFEDGVRSFVNIVRPEDFIADLEGNETRGNIGDAVPANVEHTLSWKVSSDWATRLAKVSFEVLATEDDILPLELMTIPGTSEHPETLQVSWNYITPDKSFEALLWLYADKDLGLTLLNGSLCNGDTILCKGVNVNPYDALAYIYSKMGFMLLDGAVLDYVRDATRLNLPDKSQRQYAYRVLTPAGE